jgi:hypothetical protein
MKIKIMSLLMCVAVLCTVPLIGKKNSGGSHGGGRGHGGDHGGRWHDYVFVDGAWGYYDDGGDWIVVPDYEPEGPSVVIEEDRPIVDTPWLTIGGGESRYRRR